MIYGNIIYTLRYTCPNRNTRYNVDHSRSPSQSKLVIRQIRYHAHICISRNNTYMIIYCREYARIFKNNAVSSSTTDAYRRMKQQFHSYV